MKVFYCVVFSVIPFLTPRAQTVQSAGSAIAEYFSPKDGDSFVTERSPLVIRFSRGFISHHPISDLFYEVRGQRSGMHSGSLVLSDDEQTVIFTPKAPFALQEKVLVTVTVTNDGSISPIKYSFTTTAMSELDRARALMDLRQQWRDEEQSILQGGAENPLGVIHPKGTDTIAQAPAVVVIDTIVNHEEGNIFFSPFGMANAKFSFLAITSDTASKALTNSSNSFLFEKDIPIACGNFRMQPNGTLTYFQEFSSPLGGIFVGQIVHLDQHFRVIDTFQCKGGYSADLHDFHLLPNGHALMVAYDPQYIKLKAYFDTVEGGAYRSLVTTAKDSSKIFGAIIQELDQNKNLVFQWRSWDHLQIVDATRDIKLTDSIDYCHINTADIDSTDGNIIASFRHLDEVTKINHSTGQTIWRWGGKHNQFTFGGNISVQDTTPFSHQHDPERIATGRITIFDNGNLHTKDTTINGKDTTITRPFTRALEYDLDEANYQATVVWEYDSLPVCAAAGNVQRLDNGNTMIGLGIVVQPSAVEVTPSGSKVFQMSIQKGTFSYRTYRFPFTVLSAGNRNFGASEGIESIYPNPAGSSATINFSVASQGQMKIELLDVLGHTVRTINKWLPNSGSYNEAIDLRDVPNGVYYCKLSSNGDQEVKMIAIEK